MNGTRLTRRGVVISSAASALLAASADHARAQASAATRAVQTGAGRVRGRRVNGVSSFLGIPYGADTSTRRFQPPLPAPAWRGVRACISYGNSAPQPPPSGGGGGVMGALMGPDVHEAQPADGENCLVLNVHTPDASRARKRPVLFWLHGGGFAQGNGGGPMYDGGALCRRGDVVVVTSNHRLNAMGYLYLGALHPDFADSGMVGQLDQLLALQWVRDNIEAFGGDPGNVTIFGESGGGSKVSTLLAMPAAHGLFHKAIIQSGPGLRMVERADAAAHAERTLAALSIAPADVHRLQTTDFRAIIQAALAAQSGGGRALAPVVDGRSLPRHPFDPDAPETARNIPLIIGTNKDEATLFTSGEADFGRWTAEQVQQRFAATLGDRSAAALELFRSRRPGDQPTYWYTSMVTARGTWMNSIRLAERKFAQQAGSVFMYRLDWETPAMNGLLKAPHGLDTPLVFENGDRFPTLFGGSDARLSLGADMAQAWINFARNGDPSREGLAWPRYNPTTRQTMIFDVPSHVASDPDANVRQFFNA